MSEERRDFLGRVLGRRAVETDAGLGADVFDQEMERLRRVEPRLLGYDEVDRIVVALDEPRGIAAGAAGRLWVAGDEALLLFVEGRPIRRLPLSRPAGCVCESRDAARVYVGLGDRIEVRDAAGRRLSEWPARGTGSIVTSLAADADLVFVADAGQRTVERRDGGGRLLSTLGGGAASAGPDFVVPSPFLDLALSGDVLWVSNPGRHEVGRYSLEGERLGGFGVPGGAIDAFCGCCNPTHLAVLPDGRIVTSEKGLPRVKVWSPSGRLECVVVPPQRLARAVTGLDLAVDARGRVLVLDPSQRAVRVYAAKDGGHRNG